MKVKSQEKKRILTRALATELTDEQIKNITGGVIGTNSLTSTFGNDEDDCDQRLAY